ncbi:MAG TPA: MMPL family transporter [Micromonosporaceae bacterium]
MGKISRALAALPSSRKSKWFVLVFWLALVASAAPFAGQLFSAADNKTENFLPASAESTKALKLQQQFQQDSSIDLAVVYVRESGITTADRAKADADLATLRGRYGDVSGRPAQVVPARDGKALLYSLSLPIPNEGDTGVAITALVKGFHEVVGDGGDGLVVKVTGAGAATADVINAFSGFDTKLLLLPLAVVAILLLLIYRSPGLWLIPLVTVALADQIANATVYLLATKADLTVSSFSAGLLGVLVYGAGTDYALLVIARYREELRHVEDRHVAMRRALRRALPAIVASAATVCLGLLCLLAADQNSTKGLGPVAVVGVLAALLAMISLLPALLVVFGRWIFWPRVPHAGETARTGGFWWRMGKAIARHPRVTWVTVTLLLAAMAGGLSIISTSTTTTTSECNDVNVTICLADDEGLPLGLATKDVLRNKPDSVIGAELLGEHYPAGTGAPLDIFTTSAKAAEVAGAARMTDGVSEVRTVATKGDLTWLQAIPTDAPDTRAERATIDRLRDRLGQISGADAAVGGSSALNLDLDRTNARDARVVIPIVLVVVFLVLVLLLRSLVAPLLLTLTVVLSFAAAWGVAVLVFHYWLNLPGIDVSMPLVSFVFLVALGIDYNIFLMSRVREEAARAGTRAGMLRGLAVTGGVITSAGLVLAATFAVITVLPIVGWVELGFVVAFGILLDAIIVRSVLTPALTFDVGRRMWWPSRLTTPASTVETSHATRDVDHAS